MNNNEPFSRKNFIKASIGATGLALLPNLINAEPHTLENVNAAMGGRYK